MRMVFWVRLLYGSILALIVRERGGGWKVGRCCVQWAARYVEDVKCYLFIYLFIEGLIKMMR